VAGKITDTEAFEEYEQENVFDGMNLYGDLGKTQTVNVYTVISGYKDCVFPRLVLIKNLLYPNTTTVKSVKVNVLKIEYDYA
jgi:hypothetical protein